MSKRLTGLNPLAYIGVEPLEPPNMFLSPRAPTTSDSKGFNLGDFWMDETSETLYVLVSLAAGVATWVTTFGGAATTFVTDSGVATTSGGVLNLEGDGVAINTTGSGNTVHVNMDANPSFGNITITGLTITGFTDGVLVSNNSGVISEVTTTNDSLLIGNSSGTISSLGVATDGQIPIGSTGNPPVLASITAGSGITVTPGPGSITIAATGGGGTVSTIDGDTGSATGSTITFTGVNSGQTVRFAASGATVDLNVTDGNNNTGIGHDSLLNLTSGSQNLCFGDNTAFNLTTGNQNTILGSQAFQSGNGSNNICIGEGSGQTLSGTETSNIYIASPGVISESHALRIGEGTGTGPGQLSTAFISGVQGVNVGSVADVVSISGDQLGTTTITAGSNIVVTPGPNNITISATGSGGGGASVFNADTGTATQSAGSLSVLGDGTNITTSGSGSTLTISATGALANTYDADTGSATPSGGVITFAGGTGITTSATGSTVTINNTGGTGIAWNTITTSSASMSPNNGYTANNSGLVTLTLPTTATVGSFIYVTGLGSGGWTIAQNSSQLIHFGSSVTTTGTGGSLSSTNQFDTIAVVCVVANTTFNVFASIGNITVV